MTSCSARASAFASDSLDAIAIGTKICRSTAVSTASAAAAPSNINRCSSAIRPLARRINPVFFLFDISLSFGRSEEYFAAHARHQF